MKLALSAWESVRFRPERAIPGPGLTTALHLPQSHHQLGTLVWPPLLSAVVALAGEDSPGCPVSELSDVARGYIFEPDSEPGADLG